MFIVCGHGRHGKDTFCEAASELFGLKFASSSWTARHFVYEFYQSFQHDYENSDDCWEDRNKTQIYRDMWHNAICELNTPELTTLASLIFEESDIYCGMRNRYELEACCERWPNLVSIWIDAGGRKSKEGITSNNITASDCHLTVMNDRDEESLKNKVLHIFGRMI